MAKKCEICDKEVDIRQTCKHCGKKFGPECRSPYAGTKPVCKNCG